MDNTDLTKLLSKGYYVTLGTLALLLETAQSPQKRAEVVNQWQANLGNLLDELTSKGVATESEARSFVDNMVAEQIKTVDTTATTVNPPNPQTPEDEIAELAKLTKQLADLRSQLESMGQ
jgi:polyhydroxyalkanoate synthesis regulator phasin